MANVTDPTKHIRQIMTKIIFQSFNSINEQTIQKHPAIIIIIISINFRENPPINVDKITPDNSMIIIVNVKMYILSSFNDDDKNDEIPCVPMAFIKRINRNIIKNNRIDLFVNNFPIDIFDLVILLVCSKNDSIVSLSILLPFILTALSILSMAFKDSSLVIDSKNKTKHTTDMIFVTKIFNININTVNGQKIRIIICRPYLLIYAKKKEKKSIIGIISSNTRAGAIIPEQNIRNKQIGLFIDIDSIIVNIWYVDTIEQLSPPPLFNNSINCLFVYFNCSTSANVSGYLTNCNRYGALIAPKREQNEHIPNPVIRTNHIFKLPADKNDDIIHEQPPVIIIPIKTYFREKSPKYDATNTPGNSTTINKTIDR
ncbi:hypothetical protein DERP_013157 [Dermatophagoides pteronyssinus]|uniref:Uncharacterized protein n=1 Tax=Dermatophagoides pteronyssinus TaxID=6956 RepID=A0ABQ8J393_DERPT|nr:hypothetical protein DERP_013157 [Dermatophagoides pteronyssinus]